MEATLTYYHLGSWTTITDAEGNLEQEASFDAWGNIRSASDWTSPMSEKLLFDRGYTSHEHLYFYGRYYHPNAPHTDLSLINMNGRMYDPIMSSFLSVDNYVQSPENSQNFNRYAYCLNNPLKYTDPSGEFLTWSINQYGFSIGLNFTPAGYPLGFGLNVSWANGGSVGVYGEVGYRVGGSGLGAGVGVQHSFDFGFASGFSSSTSAFGYASLGCFTAGGSIGRNWSNKANFWGVNAGIGFGRSDGNFGGGLSVGYGSSGWNVGLNGYYNKMQKSQDKIVSTVIVDGSGSIPSVGQEGDHGCLTAVYEWITTTYGIELTSEMKAEIAGCIVSDKKGNWFLKSGNKFMDAIDVGHIAQSNPYQSNLMSVLYDQIERGGRVAVNLSPIKENVGMYNSFEINDGHSVAIQSISKTEHINIFGKVTSHGYSVSIMDPAMNGHNGGYKQLNPYYIRNSQSISIFYKVH